MKKYILLFSLMVFLQTISLTGNTQNVNIPDINFKNKLIALGIDLNFDGEISYIEAEVISDLDVSLAFGAIDNIYDLTGIEAFVNLTKLNCNSNSLSSINLYNNSALKELDCSACILTNLDISNNDSLEILYCNSNYLTNLDVSNNFALISLSCRSNAITSLDVSNNILLEKLSIFGDDIVNFNVSNNVNLKYLECTSASFTSLDVTHNIYLTELYCATNQLTTLDISNNINLTNLAIFGMPSLTQVCVWILPFPDSTSVQVVSFNSPNIVYEICNVGTENILKDNSLFIYPNPASDNISIIIPQKSEIEISNLQGQIIKRINTTEKQMTIDISGLTKGMYFIKVTTENEIITNKFIKE